LVIHKKGLRNHSTPAARGEAILKNNSPSPCFATEQKITYLLLLFRGGDGNLEASVVKPNREFFRFIWPAEPATEPDFIEILARPMPIVYRRHARARNYVLRLHANRTVVVTVPRQGTRKFAREFVASRKAWLEKQWRVLEARRAPPHDLRPGMEILLHGRAVALEVRQQGTAWELHAGAERVPLPSPNGNLRPALERHLRAMAKAILVPRVEQLAAQHDSKVRRVVIRNQRSRWGSCSCQGTISLNWRLIQLPEPVRDYIIVHELMHLRQLNHSPRFWTEVERAYPDYRAAEEWLKQNSGQVGF
jgi:predicted metal-dependent hydrolase